jgi:hypothetical protein
MTSIKPTVAFLSVPQVGQFAGPPQLFEIKVEVSTIAKATRGNIFDLIESPPTMFAGSPATPSIKAALDPSAPSDSRAGPGSNQQTGLSDALKTSI